MNEVFIALVRQPDDAWVHTKVSVVKDDWYKSDAYARGIEFANFLWNTVDAHFWDAVLEKMNELNNR